MKNEIYIFGASGYGKRAYESLKAQYHICGFLDNAPDKWGSRLEGLEVFSPELLKNKEECFVIIASAYAPEIAEQIKETGCQFAIFPSLELCNQYTNTELTCRLDASALKLYTKLKELDISNLDISEYSKRYLQSKSLTTLFYYSGILYEILSQNSNINLFLEYGGGTGLLSLLASETGVSDVYYNDIYDVSCKDAKMIADVMGYRRKDYICGDAEEVAAYCNNAGIRFHAIASYDVLEHIYDIKEFYHTMMPCLVENGVLYMASGANTFCKKTVQKLIAGHLKMEFMDREAEYGHKDRDTLDAYHKIRERLIKNYSDDKGIYLNTAEIIGLAFMTRGKIKEDIENAIELYAKDKIIPEPDAYFPFNTCDPYTGNWAEHLINYHELKKSLELSGFDVGYSFFGTPEESPVIIVRCTRK